MRSCSDYIDNTKVTISPSLIVDILELLLHRVNGLTPVMNKNMNKSLISFVLCFLQAAAIFNNLGAVAFEEDWDQNFKFRKPRLIYSKSRNNKGYQSTVHVRYI